MRILYSDRSGLKEMIECLNGGIMLEVGSYIGESTEVFAKSGKFSKIYCLDFWTGGYDPVDLASNSMENAEQEFDKLLNLYPNIFKIKSDSVNIPTLFEDAFFDFIYIDANHLYDYVKRDLINSIPKLKNSRYIGGHDYNDSNHPGPKLAVDELFNYPDKIFQDKSWLKFIA